MFLIEAFYRPQIDVKPIRDYDQYGTRQWNSKWLKLTMSLKTL